MVGREAISSEHDVRALQHSLGQQYTDVDYACTFACGHSFTGLRGQGVLCSLLFLVYPPSFSPFCITCYLHSRFSTILPVQCDRCQDWGWVWQEGLVTGLVVEQALWCFQPHVPGHPTPCYFSC